MGYRIDFVNILGFLILVTLGLLGINFYFFPLSYFDNLLLIILTCLTLLFYFKKSTEFSINYRTPFSDSLILLSGVLILFYHIGKLKFLEIPSLSFLKGFNPLIGLYLLIFGIFSKLFLIDKLLGSILIQLGNVINNFKTWMLISIRNSIRVIFILIALLSLIFQNQIDLLTFKEFNLIIFSISITLFSLLSGLHEWKKLIEPLRLIPFATGFYLVFYLVTHPLFEKTTLISMSIMTISLFLWGISLISLQKIGIKFLKKLRNLNSHIYHQFSLLFLFLFNWNKRRRLNFIRSLIFTITLIIIILSYTDNNLLFRRISIISFAIIFIISTIFPEKLLTENEDLFSLAIRVISFFVALELLFTWNSNFLSLNPTNFVFILLISSLIFYTISFTLLKKVLRSIINWVKIHPIQFLQVLLFGLSILTFILIPRSIELQNFKLYIIAPIFLFILSILPNLVNFLKPSYIIMKDVFITFLSFAKTSFIQIGKVLNSLYIWIKSNRFLSFRIFLIIISIPLYFVVPSRNAILNLKYNFIVSSLLIFIAILPTLVSILRFVIIRLKKSLFYLYTKIKIIYPVILEFIKKNLFLSFRIISLLMIPVSLIFISRSKIYFIQLNYLLASFFGLVFLSPYLEMILNFSYSLFMKISIRLGRYFTKIDRIEGVSGIVLFFVSYTFQPVNNIFTISIYIVSSVLISFGWDSILMKIIDKILFYILKILNSLKILIGYILGYLTLGRLFSLFSILLFLFGLLPNPILSNLEYQLEYRFIIMISAIIIWNSIYDHRRKRIKKLISSIFRNIYYGINWGIKFLYRNVIIVFFWIIGIGFFVIAVQFLFKISGLIFIFFPNLEEILPNRLISWIIAIVLFGVGILSLQQSYINRTKLQIRSKGDLN